MGYFNTKIEKKLDINDTAIDMFDQETINESGEQLMVFYLLKRSIMYLFLKEKLFPKWTWKRLDGF